VLRYAAVAGMMKSCGVTSANNAVFIWQRIVARLASACLGLHIFVHAAAMQDMPSRKILAGDQYRSDERCGDAGHYP
jgi:hypothetical protein